jgi:hypothetical protein
VRDNGIFDLLLNWNELTVIKVSSLMLEGNLYEMKALTDLEVTMVPMMIKMNLFLLVKIEKTQNNFAQGWEQLSEWQTAMR